MYTNTHKVRRRALQRRPSPSMRLIIVITITIIIIIIMISVSIKSVLCRTQSRFLQQKNALVEPVPAVWGGRVAIFAVFNTLFQSLAGISPEFHQNNQNFARILYLIGPPNKKGDSRNSAFPHPAALFPAAWRLPRRCAQRARAPRWLRPISVLRFWISDFRGFDSSLIFIFKGWNSHVHSGSRGDFESANLSRDDPSK